MPARIRPAVVGNVPVVAFRVAGGLFAVLVDEVPLVGRLLGAMFAVGLVLYIPLLFTTWFQFDEDVVRVSSLGRVRCFRVGETTLQMYRFSKGFFAEQTAAELRSGDAHLTVALSMFRRKDQVLIERELRARFGVASTSLGDAG